MDDEVFIKNDLIDIIHDRHGLSKKDCLRLIDTVFEEITSALARDERVKMTSFGTFAVKYKKPRMLKDISTKKELCIDARYLVKFIPSAKLKKRINE